MTARTETYETSRPDGSRVRVTRNLDNGEQTVTELGEGAQDIGVTMSPGAGPSGPEDALDPDARGDYSARLGGSEYQPHEIVKTDGKVKAERQGRRP